MVFIPPLIRTSICTSERMFAQAPHVHLHWRTVNLSDRPKNSFGRTIILSARALIVKWHLTAKRRGIQKYVAWMLNQYLSTVR